MSSLSSMSRSRDGRWQFALELQPSILVFTRLGVPYWGSYCNGSHYLGSILAVPHCRKFPIFATWAGTCTSADYLGRTPCFPAFQAWTGTTSRCQVGNPIDLKASWHSPGSVLLPVRTSALERWLFDHACLTGYVAVGHE